MPETPGVGTLAHDTARNRVGVVMDRQGEVFYLRPFGGGKEWEARPEEVEPFIADEALRKRVREANERSWGTRL